MTATPKKTFSEVMKELAADHKKRMEEIDADETYYMPKEIKLAFRRFEEFKVSLQNDSKNIVDALHALQKGITSTQKAESQRIANALHDLQVTLKEELRQASISSQIAAFFHHDTTILLIKIAAVGGISYGCWKWMGFSVSDVVDGTKRNVIGALSSTAKNLGNKFTKISEKMEHCTKQLETYSKLDEPKKMSNLKTRVSEVLRDVSQCGNNSEFKEDISKMTPLEGLGIQCKLFRMDEEDVVAEAIWVTDDPTIPVQGCELGQNASKVLVTNAVDPNAKLWRPTTGIQIMEEAIKSTIAWPTDHIIYDVHYDN